MKILIIITIGLFSFFSSNAQTDTLGYELLFNRIVTVDQDTTVNFSCCNGGYSTYTNIWNNQYITPNNCIAKISQASMIELVGGNYCQSEFYILINDKKIDDLKAEGIWLKTGDIIDVYFWARASSPGYSCNAEYRSFISIIEYNKVPIISD